MTKEITLCEYFDGGTCINIEEFNNAPTEITSRYCDNECKYNKEKIKGGELSGRVSKT